MNKQDFDLLLESVKQSRQIIAGKRKPSRVFEIKAPDVKAVRQRMGVSQREFALIIGVSIRTLQNWEQGRREPEGPARALLKVASRNPEAVMDALHSE